MLSILFSILTTILPENDIPISQTTQLRLRRVRFVARFPSVPLLTHSLVYHLCLTDDYKAGLKAAHTFRPQAGLQKSEGGAEKLKSSVGRTSSFCSI